MSTTWRSSRGSGDKDLESLKELKFDGEGKRQIQRPSVTDVVNVVIKDAQGEEPWYVAQQDQVGMQRGRREKC